MLQLAKAIEIISCNATWARNMALNAVMESDKQYWTGVANGYASALGIIEDVKGETTNE